MLTATPVLHDVRTMRWTVCDRHQPAESGGHLCSATTRRKGAHLRAGLAWAIRCSGCTCSLTWLTQRSLRRFRLTARLIQLTDLYIVLGLAFGLVRNPVGKNDQSRPGRMDNNACLIFRRKFGGQHDKRRCRWWRRLRPL